MKSFVLVSVTLGISGLRLQHPVAYIIPMKFFIPAIGVGLPEIIYV